MQQKSFNRLVGFILLLVGLFHLTNALGIWRFVISGWPLPAWLSWLAVMLAWYLSYTAFQLKGISGEVVTHAEQQQQNRKVKQETIINYLQTNSEISNNQVEKLIKVSDATATRYLEELEQAGKIVQIGKTGHQVRYQLTNGSA